MPASSTELHVTVQEPGSCRRLLSITVPREQVERTRSSVSSQFAGKARLPGFRAGKTPRRIIERQFAAQIDQETMDRLIQNAYKEALEQQELHPIAQGQVTDVKYDPASDFTFDVEIEVQPTVELTTLEGFTVTRPSTEVGEADVDAVLERIRDERGQWVAAEEGKPDWGDRVTVEIQERDKDAEPEQAKPYRFVLGEGQAIPDVEQAILSLAAGEEGDFDVRFPDDFPDEAQRGQEQHLHIRLTALERRDRPELDDEFAASLGDFADLAALRERILADLLRDAQSRAEAEVRAQLLQRVAEANPFDVPRSMVDRYLDYTMGEGERQRRRKRTPEQEAQLEQYRELMRPQAEAGVKRMLVVEHLADARGLRATQDEVDARVEEIAGASGRSASDIWLELEKSGQLQALENEITENKAVEFLRSKNTVA